MLDAQLVRSGARPEVWLLHVMAPLLPSLSLHQSL